MEILDDAVIFSVSLLAAIQYLKLRIGTEAEDKKGTRGRRVVKTCDNQTHVTTYYHSLISNVLHNRAFVFQIRQELEAESIEWTNEKNGEILSIRVDGIDPQQLSFVKPK